MGEVRQQVGFRYGSRRRADARGVEHEAAQLGEDSLFDFDRAIVRVRILASYSFSSGVVKRSALTSVCLRS